ncbi:MAG: hypothetical protein Q9221_004996 [Calogaya cf. arnoldii]
MAHVRQNDPVFGSGGVLTIGLQAPTIVEKGVHWSLPLAYLRHYGAPVESARSIRSGLRSRLSLQELLQATLGSLLQSWGAAGQDTLRSLRWLSSMYHLLLEGTKLGNQSASLLMNGAAEHSWLALLSEAASVYMISEGIERQHKNKLISLGRKHGKTLLGTPSAPMFGLLEHGRSIRMLASVEERIRLLRKVSKNMAEQNGLDSSQIFIRYKHELSGSIWVYEFATALPYKSRRKRKADGTSSSIQSHHRLLYSGYPSRIDQALQEYHEFHDKATGNNIGGMVEENCALSGDVNRSAGGSAATTDQVKDLHEFERRQAILNAARESVSTRGDQIIEGIYPSNVGFFWCGRDDGPPRSYKFAFGAVDDAALFVTAGKKSFVDLTQTLNEDANVLHSIFEDCSIDKLMVAHELERSLRFARVDVDQHLRSLKAISTAATMFKRLPYASVDVRILQRPLYDASWIDAPRTEVRSRDGPRGWLAVVTNEEGYPDTPFSSQPYSISPRPPTLDKQSRYSGRARFIPFPVAAEGIHEPLPSLDGLHKTPAALLPIPSLDGLHGIPAALLPYELSMAQAFACVAMFESGQHDIDPGQLTDVMAMSSGDSIYVSAALLTDPYDETRPRDIRDVMGNIGRPGITFLVPPKSPMIKRVSIDEWPLIERHEFDGYLSDHFQNTSLHLSSTNAETPLNLGFSGGQDHEACILETLFSVYEGGRWIADLDVSSLMTNKVWHRFPRCTSQHVGSWHPKMTCIDSWLGLVDAPEEKVSLVRAHRNWQARLAALSISLALNYEIILLPDDVCWQCLGRNVSGGHGINIIAIG